MKKGSILAKIITPVDLKYGAPMGRDSVGSRYTAKGRIYDSRVPLDDQGYDFFGAYWGTDHQQLLRVAYTKDLSYIEFYRIDRMHEVYFNNIPHCLTLSQACVDECSSMGDVAEEVDEWVQHPAIAEQMDTFTPELIRLELKPFGAWDEAELADDMENRRRLLWLAANEVSETLAEEKKQ